MPMPMDAENAAVPGASGEGKLEDASVETIMVKRVADYLPEKRVEKTMNPKSTERMFGMLYSLCTGGYLTLSDKLITTKREGTGAKENLVNECTNLGLISALFLTMAIPISFDNVTDWLEEDFAGSGSIFVDSYISSLLTENQIQNGLKFLNDFALIFYVTGVMGFLYSTGTTVVELLCVQELGTDSGCQDFMRRAGKATHAPYFMFVVGCVFAIIPGSVRFAVSCKTLPGLIIVLLVMVVMNFLGIAVNYIYVAACTRAHNRVNEFQELNLSNTEAQQDVEAWFEKTQHGAHVQDCFFDLCGIVKDGSSEIVIPLDTVSKRRVALHFHKLCSESVGITLPAAELYKLSCQLQE